MKLTESQKFLLLKILSDSLGVEFPNKNGFMSLIERSRLWNDIMNSNNKIETEVSKNNGEKV